MFLSMKKVLKGGRFANVEEMKTNTTEALKGITSQNLQGFFEHFRTRRDTHVGSKGEYVPDAQCIII